MVRDPRAVTLVLAATAYATVYQQAYSTLPLVMGRDGLSAAAYGAIVAVNGVVIVLMAVGPALGTWVLSRLGEPVLWLGSLALLVAAALAVSRLHAPSADVPPPPACAERG